MPDENNNHEEKIEREIEQEQEKELKKDMIDEEGQKIVGAEITEEMKKAYIDYAMSVIVARALPAVEDGLKPVQRRILFAMNELGLDKGQTKKSARIIGECFVKDTQVLTTRGLLPVQEISRGDFVYTQKGVGEVVELYEMPEKDLIKTTLDNGTSVIATNSQKFKILNESLEYEWKEASELKEKDFIVIKADYPDIKENVKLKIFNNKYLELNENIAYLLGQFLSDGWIEKERNRIGFCSSSEKIINRIKFILESEFSYNSNIEIKSKNYSTTSGELVQSQLYVIRINNGLLCNFLASTFDLFNKNAYTKEIPHQILISPKKTIYSFLSGLIDGDGSIHKSRNIIQYGSISEKLIDRLLLITQQLRIIGKKYLSKSKNTHFVNGRIIKSNYPSYSIEFGGEFSRKLACNLNLADEEKRRRADRLSSIKAGKSSFEVIPFLSKAVFSELSEKHLGSGWYSDEDGNKFRQGVKYASGSKIRYPKDLKEKGLRKSQIIEWGILDKLKRINSKYYSFLEEVLENKVYFLSVNKIEKIASEKTYDIQVKNEHEFIANGIVSHNCMGKYHPHGDMAIYDALVRMAQDFSLRYPLILGQGNFGSLDNDPAAASRYTEAKLNSISNELLEDLEKETVKMLPNFDNSLKEPETLPAKLPNLLLNGATGIAVGMATNIPPHNLNEVCEAITAYINKPEITIEKLSEIIQAPDFPTGASVSGEILEMYKTGKGKLDLRARTTTEEHKGKTSIIVTEIPYMVNKADLVSEIAKLVQNKKLPDVSDLRDESSKGKVRIVIELRKGADFKFSLNRLFQFTRLQDSFDANIIALVAGKPRQLNLKQIIEEYVKYREKVVERRTRFDLKKAENRLEIVLGLLIALKDIDNVISLIKKSKHSTEALENLINKFKLTRNQAQAILDMKLSGLTSLEQEKLRNEEKSLKELIKELQKILSSESEILSVIKKEIFEIKRKYSDARRTQILQRIKEISEQDLVEKKEVVITITDKGYAKRMDIKTYKEQKRGGKGVIGSDLATGDFVKQLLTCNTHDYLLFFTSKGKVYWLKAHEIPAAERYSKGKALVNMLNLKEETIQSVMAVKKFEDYLIFVTKKGIVKKLKLADLSKPRASGVRAINLPADNSDSLVDVKMIKDKQEVILVTKKGIAIRFNSDSVRAMGRASYGVTGVKLNVNDEVVSLEVVDDVKATILTITEKGYGKRSNIEDYRLISRAGKGVINLKVKEKTGNVVTTVAVKSGDSVIVTTAGGMVIKIAVKGLRIMGRATQGVHIVKLKAGDKVADLVRVPEIEEVGEVSEKV